MPVLAADRDNCDEEYIDEYENTVCNSRDDGGADDRAYIGPETCQVSCVDSDTGLVYSLMAEGEAIVWDDGDNEWQISYTLTYNDPVLGDQEINTYYDKLDGTEGTGRGVVFSLYPIFSYDGYGIFQGYNSAGYYTYYSDNVANNWRSVWDAGLSHYLLPLYFSSWLGLTLNDNKIKTNYYHKINYQECDHTFIEFYVCSNDGGGSTKCPSHDTDDTAIVDCILHWDEDGKAKSKWIRSVDSEGKLNEYSIGLPEGYEAGRQS